MNTPARFKWSGYWSYSRTVIVPCFARPRTIGRLVVALAFAAGARLTAQTPAAGGHPLRGRVFAPVMGAAGTGWLDRPERVVEDDVDAGGCRPSRVGERLPRQHILVFRVR
jgi:hypothetical protein